MAESYIFFHQNLVVALDRYKSVYDKLLNTDCIIEPLDDDVFKCNNMHFYELNTNWCVGENIEGNTYSIERLYDLAGDAEIIYLYFDEDLLDGELVVIREGKIVRKLFDYYSTPELNENIGQLEYEKTKKLISWVDIASYSEYLFECI